MADYITTLFSSYNDGIKIERVAYAPRRDNLIISIGNGSKILGFSGDEDVVSAGEL